MIKNNKANWIVWYKYNNPDGPEYQDSMEFTYLVEALYWYARVKYGFGNWFYRSLYKFEIKLYNI